MTPWYFLMYSPGSDFFDLKVEERDYFREIILVLWFVIFVNLTDSKKMEFMCFIILAIFSATGIRPPYNLLSWKHLLFWRSMKICIFAVDLTRNFRSWILPIRSRWRNWPTVQWTSVQRALIADTYGYEVCNFLDS